MSVGQEGRSALPQQGGQNETSGLIEPGLSEHDALQVLQEYGGGVLPEEATDFANEYFAIPIIQQIEELEDDIVEPASSDIQVALEPTRTETEEERPLFIKMQDQHNGHESVEDGAQIDEVEKFISAGCGCSKNCIQRFDRQVIIQSHLDSLNLDEYCNMHINHQHILLLGAMNALVNTSTTTEHKGRGSAERVKSMAQPMFRGVAVCRNFFNFVFGCGDRRHKNVKKQFMEEGLIPRQHQNVYKTSHVKSMPIELRLAVVQFINCFSQQHALVLPGRLPAFSNLDLKILPCSMSKKYIYNQYRDACLEIGNDAVTLASWYKIWKQLCGHVVIQRPRSDLCPECQKNVLSLVGMQNLSEDEKELRLRTSLDHLTRVKEERSQYKKLVEISKELLKGFQPPMQVGKHLPCSLKHTVHYSFDYAQQVHLPHSSQQVGPLYFLVGYKVGLFGVAIEPLGKFVLYIIPESCVTGKGSNIVISMMHHFFENFGLGEEDVHCHADNCSGQNKNNYLMQYAIWRTVVGLHKSFKISFLPVGHTKFAPDLYFGLFKRCFRKSDVNCLDDVKEVGIKACPISKSIIPCLVGNENGIVNVQSMDWQELFASYKATRIPKLLQYFQFEAEREKPGWIECRKTSTDATTTCHKVFALTSNMQVERLPSIIYPEGLSEDRKKYLYDNIRQYVKGNDQKNKLCPAPVEVVDETHGQQEDNEESHAPDQQQLEINLTPQATTSAPATSTLAKTSARAATPAPEATSNEATSAPEAKFTVVVPTISGKRRTCTYCKQPGHRNQVIRGRPLCPARMRDESESKE